MMRTKFACLLGALALGFATTNANAAPAQANTLQDAVRKAIVGNPEVQARWHTFLASGHEQDVARGSYYPRLDLSAGMGRERLSPPAQPTSSLNRRDAGIALSQMLYDGFSTREDVARLGYARLTRYYELLDASETTALEAAQAYYDVLRHRDLSRLAQENFAQHQQVFSQIQQRVQAGVGRRVDLEQAGGRMALSQSNLITEASNLHDVSARYLRIVGELPPGEMIAPELLQQGIPSNVEEALKLAYQGSPAFNATIENVRAAQAEARGRESGFQPRVDLRARSALAWDADGITGRRDDQTVELVLNYNLFRGGADRAQVRQYAERLELSRDLRDKACRDLRQTLSIAYNNIHNLSQQKGFLEQHQLSIEKAREAYRKQFDIGQRTLLDLLDTENEYFQARRAAANAQYDHAVAHARTLAGMGQLLAALQVGREGLPTPQELGQDRQGVDPASQCPADAPPTTRVEFVAAATPAAPPVQATESPRPPAVPAETVQQALAGWAAAWSAKDFPRYRAYYARNFAPDNGRTPEQWASDRAVRLAKPGDIVVGIDQVKLEPLDAERTATEFHQTYSSPDYRDITPKRIEWVREGDRWKIQRETTLAAPQRIAPPDSLRPVPKKRLKRKPAKECVCK